MSKSNLSNLYYLQEMGVDVWKLREINSKILVLIFPHDNQYELASKAQNLLENILFSTGIKRIDFELVYIREYKNLEKINLKFYKAIITIGDSLQNDESFLDRIRRNKLPIIKITHPNLLLIRPVDKREAYLSLQQLEFNYV
jgi:hypothetical protein